MEGEKPTMETKEDKMEKVELTPEEIRSLEDGITMQIEKTIESFNRHIMRRLKGGEEAFENTMKEVYDDNNWEKQPGYAYKKQADFPGLAGSFTESVFSNLAYDLGMENWNEQLIGIVARRAMEKNPQLKTYIDTVIHGVKKQGEIVEQLKTALLKAGPPLGFSQEQIEASVNKWRELQSIIYG